VRSPRHHLVLACAPCSPWVLNLSDDRSHRALGHGGGTEHSPYRVASGEQIDGGLPFAHVVGVEDRRLGEDGVLCSQSPAQAVQHCLRAKAAVADLTNGNPNVYYELSVRHGAQLPVVLIADTGTKLPFDISQSRVIFFDPTDLSSAGEAREELGAQIAASLDAPPDNPIYQAREMIDAYLSASSERPGTADAVLAA
jgi:hypothetical protein